MSEVWHRVLLPRVAGAGIGFAHGSVPALIKGAVPAGETAAADSPDTPVRSAGTPVAGATAG
ncbi:hypothetical protein SUDANB6_05511 [Streptomyces sp. enrichment culture]